MVDSTGPHATSQIQKHNTSPGTASCWCDCQVCDVGGIATAQTYSRPWGVRESDMHWRKMQPWTNHKIIQNSTWYFAFHSNRNSARPSASSPWNANFGSILYPRTAIGIYTCQCLGMFKGRGRSISVLMHILPIRQQYHMGLQAHDKTVVSFEIPILSCLSNFKRY